MTDEENSKRTVQEDLPEENDNPGDRDLEGTPQPEESLAGEAHDTGVGRGRWIDSMLQRLDRGEGEGEDAKQALPHLIAIEPTHSELVPLTATTPVETADHTLIEEFPEFAEIEAEDIKEESSPPPLPNSTIVATDSPRDQDDLVEEEGQTPSSFDESTLEDGQEFESGGFPRDMLEEAESEDSPPAVMESFEEEQRTPTGPVPSPEVLSFGADVQSIPEETAGESQLPLPLQLALDRAFSDPSHRIEDLRKEFAAEDDEQQQALIEHEIGYILQCHVGDESDAVKAYANSLNLDPTLRPNIWAIRRIFIARKMWPNLLKLYDAEIHFEESTERKSEVLLEKGWILEDHLQNFEEAKACYWEAHHYNDGWLAPLVAIERLAILQDDLSTLTDVYPKMAQLVDDPDRKVAVLLDLARLEERVSGGTPQTALRILNEALELNHNRAGVLIQMEQVARQSNLVEALPQILRWQADDLSNTEPIDSRRAAAKLRAAAQIAKETLQDLDLAQELLFSAREISTDEKLIQQDLLTLAEERGNWSEVEKILTDQLEQTTTKDELAALHYRIGLARIEAKALDASEAMDQAMELVPGFLPALIEQERRFLARNNMEELVNLWLKEAEAIVPQGTSAPLGEDKALWFATVLWRSAMVAHHQLKQPARALEYCQRALDAFPGFRPALDAMESLLRETGDFERLALHLQDQLAKTTPETAFYYRESLAALYDGILDRPEQLLELLEKHRQEHPEDLRNTQRLIHTLERLQSYDRLAEILAELENDEEDEQRRLGWKLYHAQVLEGPLQRPDPAIAVYKTILQRAPDHTLALAALEDLLRRENRYDELSILLRQAADQALPDAAGQQRKYDLLQQLGTIFSRQLNRPADAVIVYSELLSLRPDDLAVCRDLHRSARMADDPAKIAETLEALSELISDPSAKSRLYMRLAEIYEDRLADENRAEELLVKAISTAPQKREVLDAIESVVRYQIRRGDFGEAVAGLQTLAAEPSSVATSIFLEEAAWLTAGPLSDGEGASDLWYRLQQEDPQNKNALWAKMRLSARKREVQAIAESSRRLAEITTDRTLENALNLRAGLLADLVGDPESSAADTYRRVLQNSPDTLEAVLALLAKEEITPLEESELTGQLARIAPDKVREEMRLPLGLINQRAGKLSAAVSELTPLLERNPEHLPALMILQRIAAVSKDSLLEAKTWVHLGSQFSDKRAKAEAFNRGALLLEKLSRPADAAILLRHVLSLQPDNKQAFARLQQIYREINDQKGIEELLGHQIRNNQDQSAAIGLYFERSEIRLQQLGDTIGAARDLLHVLKINTKHSEALRQLSRLYDEDKNYPQALKLYHQYTDSTESLDLQRPAVIRMAEILHEHLGRTADAVDVCRRFLDRSPDDEAMLEKLVTFFVKLRDFPHAISILERLGGLRDEQVWKADKLRQMGIIYWKDMKVLGEARKTLMQARDVDPTNIEIVNELRLLCQEMNLEHDIDRLLERAKDDIRDALTTVPLSIDLYRKLMQVAEWGTDEYTLLGSLGILCFFGVAEQDDQELYRKRIARGTFDPKHQVGAQAWREALVDSRALSAYGSLWSIVADYVPRLYESKVPADPFTFGVTKGDKINRNAGGPISITLDRISRAFGLGDFDIYLSPKRGNLIQGIAADKSSIVIGAAVVSANDSIQRFRIGRTLSLLRDKAFALELLTIEELELFFSAVIFNVESGADFALPRAQVEVESRRIHKVLSRKAQRSLRLAVNRFMQEGGALNSWVSGVLATANRAGLLACGDILVALEQLVNPPPHTPTEQLIELIGKNQQAIDLLIYSVGAGYLGLRKELQL